MRFTPFIRTAVCIVIFAMFDFAILKAQSTIFDDTFSDGERSVQNLPTSVAWYHGAANPSPLAVKNGVLELTFPGDDGRNFWAYFPVVSLKVGEAITFTFDFRFTGNPANSAMRIGLCYTNGVAAHAANGVLPTGNYQGYASMGFSDPNTTVLRKRDGPGSAASGSGVLNALGMASNEIWRAL